MPDTQRALAFLRALELPPTPPSLAALSGEPATIESGDEIIGDGAWQKRVRALAREFPEVLDLHEIVVRRVGGRLYLSCHCTMSDELPLSRVHEVSTALEGRLKQESPQLFKVLIHPEPQTDNRR